jgi:hypothetical protein
MIERELTLSWTFSCTESILSGGRMIRSHVFEVHVASLPRLDVRDATSDPYTLILFILEYLSNLGGRVVNIGGTLVVI